MASLEARAVSQMSYYHLERTYLLSSNQIFYCILSQSFSLWFVWFSCQTAPCESVSRQTQPLSHNSPPHTTLSKPPPLLPLLPCLCWPVSQVRWESRRNLERIKYSWSISALFRASKWFLCLKPPLSLSLSLYVSLIRSSERVVWWLMEAEEKDILKDYTISLLSNVM